MYPPFTPAQYARPSPTVPPPPLSIPQHQTYPQHTVASATIPPPSPSQSSEMNEEANFNLSGPPPISRIYDGKAWGLIIEQQPVRARMCGFGDKDRRPISPPPCVRLMIVDTKTNREVDYSKYENLARYVLMVDLSSLDTSEEKNLVKHTSTSPSISSVTTTSYPPTMTTASPSQPALQNYNISNLPAYASQSFASPLSTSPQPPNPYQNGMPQQPYYGNGVTQYVGRPAAPYAEQRYPPQYQNGYQPAQHLSATVSLSESRGSVDGHRMVSPGMCTRNLIGSLSGSAFKLQNLKNEVGLWFVFQDLSIRTEGWFRLKFTFFDLMGNLMPEDPTTPKLSELAPMLASVFSSPFKVYSAKRFPGVIESTDLSRKFASQGIKIPIRKDGQKPGEKRRRDRDSDEDDDDDDDE